MPDMQAVRFAWRVDRIHCGKVVEMNTIGDLSAFLKSS